MKRLKQSIVVLSITLLSQGIQADLKNSVYAGDHNVDHHGLYLGAAYGYVKSEGADEFDDDNDVGRVFVGGQFNQVVSVEGSYIDFGRYGNSIASSDIDGLTLAVKAGLPVGEYFTLYALGGNLWWDADLEALGVSDSADGQELFYGAGGSFALSHGLDLRLEYTRFNVELERDEVGIFATSDELESDLDYISLALQYTF